MHSNPADLFIIEDEVIRFHGKKIAYLMTDKSYENFELSLEYRWNTDSTFIKRSKNKNSGVMYLISPLIQDKIWPKGIQFQVKEGNTGDIILIDGYSLDVEDAKQAGKNIIATRYKDSSNATGDWNTITIRSRKGEIIQKLNGKVINKGKNPETQKGKILLQYEGYPIDFRNITITTF
ncbi:hypothetical protein NH26_23270 [Flammeovirga pacifica]|uniref:3-keto-alpha-glucoside-1,2-lyase/3-keto-2-hydroxy-glucal hydratase domain-containing protein n=1 Tax=Flammeovirga pacifica TaxID=915059 RepID=A0A1S1YUW1_FLAPC|nr:hypothetical protein NH26_23270 [Flammeovirga pacifica]